MGEAGRAAGEFIWYHGNMNQYISILDVKQERRLDLEQIRVILDQEVTSCLFSLRRQLLEQSPTRPDSGNRWQNVDAMGDTIQPSSELVFEARQSGVEKRGVEHDLVKECRPNLVESGF
jgi:hypothetical protein